MDSMEQIPKKSNSGLIIGLVIVLLAIIAVVIFASDKKDKVMVNGITETSGGVVMKDADMAGDDMMKKEEMGMEDKEVEKSDVMMNGSYQAYSPEKIAMADTGKVVLFFHASWCPSCRGLNSDIEKNMSAIPEGVTILKTDYDTQTELKKKYGVTSQHTLVQVDKDGNLIKKWSGSPGLSSLVAQIN